MKRRRMVATCTLAFSALLTASSTTSAQAGSEGTKAADASSLLNRWAAQTELRAIWLVWNHMQGVVGYTVSCEIGARARRVYGNMVVTSEAKDASGLPRRLSYFVPVSPGGDEHRCYLQWTTVAKGPLSAPVPFNTVTPVATFTFTKPPSASATARVSAPGEITVTWDDIPGATAYNIGRSVSPYGFRSFCNLCPLDRTIVDRNVKAGSKHIYTVTAITPSGSALRLTSNMVVPGGSSDVVVNSADPGVSPDLKRPGGVWATVNSATTILVSWQAVPDAAGYDVYRSVNGGAYVRLAGIANRPPGSRMEFPDYVGGVLAASSQISVRYAVRSTDSNGRATEAAISNDVQIDSKAAVSGTITSTNASNAKAVATSASSVTLTWSPPAGSLSCALGRSLGGGLFAPMPAIPVNAASYIDTAPGLMDQRPRYRITCATPKSPLPAVSFSDPVWETGTRAGGTISSTGSVPNNLRAVLSSVDSVMLTWGPPTTAIACTVQRSINGGPYESLRTLPIGAFQYADASSGLASRRPRYQLACGDAKSAVVSFPDPVREF